MKKVFLDCGAHKFEGLREFIPILNLDEDWEVHSFEANPTINLNMEARMDPSWPFKLTIWRCGVGAEQGVMKFVSEGLADEGGQGSRVLKNWHEGVYSFPGGKIYETPIIRLSSFIRDTFSEDTSIVMKFDIEGSEFDIIEDFVANGLPPQIHTMYVEWHERFFPPELNMAAKRVEYSKFLTDSGIELHDWK